MSLLPATRALVSRVVSGGGTPVWTLPVRAEDASCRVGEATVLVLLATCRGAVPQGFGCTVVDVVGVAAEANGAGG